LQNDLDVSVTEEQEKVAKSASLETLVKDSKTFRLMQVILGQYILLEQFFMAQSVQKVNKKVNLFKK